MESINIIEGLLVAAIKALPVEDFYKLRGEEPPKAGTDLTKATSEELAQALVDRDDEGVVLKAVTSRELAQALIDQGEECEIVNVIDLSDYFEFEDIVDAFGSDQVLDYVACNLYSDDILHRLDEDEVAAWVAGTGRTVLNTSLESITKELAQVLLQHAEEAE